MCFLLIPVMSAQLFCMKYRPALHLHKGTEIRSVIPDCTLSWIIQRHGDDTIANTNARVAVHLQKLYIHQIFDLCRRCWGLSWKRDQCHKASVCVMIRLYSGHNARNKSTLWQMHNGFELYCSFRLYIKVPITELWHTLLWPLIYVFGMLSP